MTAQEQATSRSWHAIAQETVKRNQVRAAVHVPDRVLTPRIRALHGDNDFTAFAATPEEEALGILDDKPAVATAERDPAGLLRDRFMRGLGVRE